MAENRGFSLFNEQKLKWLEKIAGNEFVETWRASAFELDPPVQYIISVFRKIESAAERVEFNELLAKVRAINHPSLLNVIGFTASEAVTARPTIFYEFCSTETLESALKEGSLTVTEKLMVLGGVACASQVVESKGLEMGPVDASNVFLNSEHEPKVCNFGIPKFVFGGKATAPIRAFGELAEKVMQDEEGDEAGSMPGFFVDLCAQCDVCGEKMTFEGIVRSFMSEGFLVRGADAQVAQDYLIKAMSPEFAKKMVIAMFQQAETHKAHVEGLRTDIDFLSDEFRKVRKQLNESCEEDRGMYDVTQEVKCMRQEMAEMRKLLDGFLAPDPRITLPVSFDKIGVFGYLINSQRSPFDRFVIASQSSGDLYSIIDKDNPGNFSSGSGNYEWVQFQFNRPITVNKVMIQSAHRSFMRSWSIVSIDEDGNSKTLYQTTDDPALNGVNFSVTVDITPAKSRIFRIEKMGPNWANTNFIRIKNVEFYSPSEEFEGGVFATLLKQSHGDPHKADVVMTASNFDFRNFHALSPPRSLCTLYDPDNQPWIQFELTKGKIIVEGYRMQQLGAFLFDKWSVHASVDKKNWVLLDRRSGNVGKSPLKVVRCPTTVPYSVFRVVCEMDNSDGDVKLRMRHFDLFGVYLED